MKYKKHLKKLATRIAAWSNCKGQSSGGHAMMKPGSEKK